MKSATKIKIQDINNDNVHYVTKMNIKKVIFLKKVANNQKMK